ncbi:glyoxylase-like metal-dependent hydrolase (beta-lactamase superfamily II) [Motilibacter rhizosphaerae]|uniref:Glyoxylase-like metal-dependent hydrolase (Beta-lactamase superfamily II) n=1 Tax=Motilibacter rhizosphaerae TaxID=598652 RepID=A0A4V2F4Y3_9ACTN|nr:MBL fold metallo-hydrolase [Motilibacter rhizosphaerae]RZS90919.1 glyoxylase-like metal-dependent hydrolase (beta-lactamase superfamily II) [Motilibacter rhizosphaerae]
MTAYAEFPQGLRIERVVTAGTFELDGGSWEVENNVWLIGNDAEVVVIDPAHDPEAILAAVGERELLLVVCTHGHNDHINAAVEVAAEKDAEIALHPKDGMLWQEEYGADLRWDVDLADQGGITVADLELTVLHTPGHSPGAVCLHASDIDVVFTGDTLFNGGPGATGRKYSDRDLIVRSIRRKLLDLSDDTRVLTGHGEETTIEAERAGSRGWDEDETAE